MNAILSLWSAVANLARAANRLAAVADVVADEAERRIEVVAHDERKATIEASQSALSNGRQRKATASGNA